MNQTIIIDTDTLNDGADAEALRSAMSAEFGPDVEVLAKRTGRGTEFRGFADVEDVIRRAKAVSDRADF